MTKRWKLATRSPRWCTAIAIVFMATLGITGQALAADPAIPGVVQISAGGTCSGTASGQTIPITVNLTRLTTAPDHPAYDAYVTRPSELALLIIRDINEPDPVGLTPAIDPALFVVGNTFAISESFVLNATEAAALTSNGTVTIPISIIVPVFNPVDQAQSTTLECDGTLIITGCQAVTPTPVTPTETPVTPTETPITPTETPVTPTETPVTPTETPVTPSETPVTPTETPVTPTETPATPTEPSTSTPTPTDPTTPAGTPTAPVTAPATPGTTPTPVVPTKLPSTGSGSDGSGAMPIIVLTSLATIAVLGLSAMWSARKNA